MRHGWLVIALGLLAPNLSCAHILPRPFKLNRINRGLHGQIVDHTANSGRDYRIWSAALQDRRDLYVYLPPGFDPCKKYPLVVFLHGFNQDESAFIDYV